MLSFVSSKNSHNCQRGHFVTTYAREFTRMKRFALELVNTDYQTIQRFILGLDKKICRTVEMIVPNTYASALIVAKAMEGVDES